MKAILLSIMMLYCITSVAQSTIQPTIMVIPYVKENEDLRTVLEKDENKRIALTKIKEAFDSRGVSTIDFIAKLKAIETENIINIDNKTDLKSQIIDMSGADIYVEAEIVIRDNMGESDVKMIVTAYDSATGESLANVIGSSGTYRTSDYAKLAMKAISNCADDFLSVIQQKFTTITENGRSIMLTIGFNSDSEYSMDTEIGESGFLLQDEIELFLAENAYKGYYHIQGSSTNKMIVDIVKIPLVDDNGDAYTIGKFSMKLLLFFKSLNIPINRSTNGNTIYITIK